MKPSQLLSPADGNVVQTLTDPRVLATGAGVVGAAFAERALWKAARKTFGHAGHAANGATVYFAPKADGSVDTSTPAPRLGVNRQLARAALIVGAVAAIEYVDQAETQYALLGMAALWLAHVAQEALPALNS